MAELSTQYLGMTLKSPIIVGSCGLTSSVERIKELERYGAGAIVLKSIFEEEIAFEFQDLIQEAAPGAYNLEQFDYYDFQVKEERIAKYVALIKAAKKAVSIPVIASVNCMYSHEWTFFAQRLQAAGADALELNMFFSPFDLSRSTADKERVYFEIVAKVLSRTSIPVTLKISPYFTDLGLMIQRLSKTGIAGLVLFNRFFNPDFDIDRLEVTSEGMFSAPTDYLLPLRWVAVMSGRVNCDLVASTGVHDGETAIKQLLAGAKAVQVVSALYRHGPAYLEQMLKDVQNWMTRNEYYAVEQFRGQMAQAKGGDPAMYERFQFMKHFGGVQ
jgi:dihydroorotate dehydrogenase (fumarate)